MPMQPRPWAETVSSPSLVVRMRAFLPVPSRSNLRPGQRQGLDPVDALHAAELRGRSRAQVPHPRGEEADRLLQLRPRQVGAEAEMRPGAEGQRPPAGLGGDVELLTGPEGAVGPLRADRDDAPGREDHAAMLDLA